MNRLILYGKGGFTLMELLIGMAVMGITMAMVYGAHTALLSVMGHVEQAASHQHRAGMVFDQLRQDLAGTYKGSSGLFEAAQYQNVDDGKPFLQFTTSSQLRFDPSAIRASTSIVSYYLVKPRKESNYSIYRTEITNQFWFYLEPGSRSVPILICDDVVDVTISYKDRYGRLLDQWQARSSARKGKPDDGLYPSLVRVELVLADSSNPKKKRKLITTTINIPSWQLTSEETIDEG